MLTHLRLTGFRNLADARLDIPAEGLALVGANAQGKSNLLEAIHYLEIFRSFRSSPDSRLIRFGEDHFRVEGHVDRADMPAHVIAAAYQRKGRVKKVVVDGVEPDRLGDAIGQVGTVLFTPEDVRIVSDGPDERRRFLNILLSLNRPGYLESLQQYRQALAQRNAALRDQGPVSAIRAWDGLLGRLGGRVSSERARWVVGHADSFARIFRAISGGEVAEMEYQPGSTTDPPGSDALPEAAAWEERFRSKLDELLDSDRQRGTTQSGPHRDELRIRVGAGSKGSGPRDVRHYGSGGQRRTAALALRLIEADTAAERRGRPPVLLLDDVFAELDAGRSERLVERLDQAAAGQVILTAPKRSDLHFRRDLLPRWQIRAGVVTADGDAT